MVLPNHVIAPAEPPSFGTYDAYMYNSQHSHPISIIEAHRSKATQEAYQQYLKEAIVNYKKQLAEARERYGI
ncbi:predicted protein [Lichtheimia corymbifera JMRC:FSU:9682]|uniref:Uncharacterized protein n=1 Tax=Lichtheimia corymbifera JMRC:FSU:9682 TaxID=1263082 RepID=A0A068SDQ1_9FUNG|nr:predicted protein [Lichtheimia corymbifera JMRC:FSU:9682]